ncbi:hypothetical protein BT63DRAFT_228607 [Microthyrium microscopicum]|uniref:Uncharacterized protein n=1 Tax=Microthyrium microscopicum TaxID=703497 RepID=A0A6A6UEY9_9PEZI|nr:hypothetical protein BT63DRAFT_228607 [Microthyrium microscopicum]
MFQPITTVLLVFKPIKSSIAIPNTFTHNTSTTIPKNTNYPQRNTPQPSHTMISNTTSPVNSNADWGSNWQLCTVMRTEEALPVNMNADWGSNWQLCTVMRSADSEMALPVNENEFMHTYWSCNVM